jgi:hypothetical protein
LHHLGLHASGEDMPWRMLERSLAASDSFNDEHEEAYPEKCDRPTPTLAGASWPQAVGPTCSRRTAARTRKDDNLPAGKYPAEKRQGQEVEDAQGYAGDQESVAMTSAASIVARPADANFAVKSQLIAE